MNAIILAYPVLVFIGVLLFLCLFNFEKAAEERRERERTWREQEESCKRLEEEMKRAASRVAAEMKVPPA
jgi:hypothetical protein